MISINDTKIVSSIARDDFMAPSPNIIDELRMNYDSKFQKLDITDMDNVSYLFETKKEATTALKKIKLDASLEKEGGYPKLNLATKDSLFQFQFEVNSAKGIYCNKEQATVNSGIPKPFVLGSRWPKEVPNVFFGNDYLVEKVTVEIDALTRYGVKKKKINKGDVEVNHTGNLFNFRLIHWNDSILTMSYFPIVAYNAAGKRLTKVLIRDIWPQNQFLSKLLGIPENKISAEQFWLYSVLLDKYKKLHLYEMKFEEPVHEIVLIDFEGSVTERKTVEVSNDERVKEKFEKIKKRRLEKEKRFLKKQEEEKKKKERKQSSHQEQKTKTGNDEDIEVVESTKEPLFTIVDEMPEFKGGKSAMHKYLQKNIQYPQEAKDKKIAGKVYVQFIIEKDGNITNIKVIRSAHQLLEKEAIRLVENMPKWIPGHHAGNAVKVRFYIPVSFDL